MTAPNFGPNDVMNALWGSLKRMIPHPGGYPDTMPEDSIVMYDGATHKNYPWTRYAVGGWWAWDMRGVLFTLAHDLLRFRKLDEVKNFDTTIEHGIFDWVLYIASRLAPQDGSQTPK